MYLNQILLNDWNIPPYWTLTWYVFKYGYEEWALETGLIEL